MWKYWDLGDAEGTGERSRWELEPAWPIEFKWQFREGRPIRNWSTAQAVVYCTPTSVLEDMPFSLDGTLIVSDRFRELLEREVPGDIQFLPVRMVGPGAKGLKHDYWILNTLREFECIDKARSFNERDDRDGPYVEIPVIDPSKIPQEARIGRIKEYRVIVLVRDDLKQIIEHSGMIGPAFFNIWHSGDDGAPPPTWKPGVRRSQR